ncbi:MAG: response regulator transcription factor [Planctomycetota bacterium]
MAQESVLVVEDEEVIARGIADALRFNELRPELVSDGEAAYELARTARFDVIILDVMLPGLSGLDVLRRIRTEQVDTPVIILTARGGEDQRVEGLELGADDYVTKPFSIKELIARVRAQLRRRSLDSGEIPDELSIDGLSIDFRRLECMRGDQHELLTRREADIFLYLFEHKDRVVTRDELLLKVWRYPTANVETRTVDNHIVKLRQKVEADPANPLLVRTVRGQGYKFGA